MMTQDPRYPTSSELEEIRERNTRDPGDPLNGVFLHVTPRCEHVWDGPEIEIDGVGWSVTCSRCGLDAMTHSLREGL